MNTPIRAKTLKGIMGAESQLARKEARDMLNALPADHPLVHAADEERKRSGDIAELPDGHPLKVELAEAKQRFDERKAEEAAPAKPDVAKVRKAKRIKETREFQERLAREEIEKQERVAAAKTINGAVDRGIVSMDEVLTVARQNFDLFGEDPFIKARLSRLERLAMAVRRGLVEGKLSTVRLG